ncbi:hypothetical protein M2139_001365 [Enterococcus sp. PF1-24]|uniref:hypothetical protein n=1 Tax=unclassified Enterococcus TaxID=2608891 RepID=UPI002474BC35|nr:MULTISPECIES: hypothetical protein [unclassified Enterococcus]MDH6364330.1 hypothetical protein [Enterococcus sp. PFB1-1]MDH6401481.1 hypothetical protein [Enterococcus sp. PF1-24]
MRKLFIHLSFLALVIGLAAPVTALANEAPAAEVTETVVYAIPADAQNITAINFDRGFFSPDIYLSSRLTNAIIWAGGGAVSVLVAAIPVVGPQMAQAVVNAINNYTGSVANGIFIHITNGWVDYIAAQ